MALTSRLPRATSNLYQSNGPLSELAQLEMQGRAPQNVPTLRGRRASYTFPGFGRDPDLSPALPPMMPAMAPSAPPAPAITADPLDRDRSSDDPGDQAYHNNGVGPDEATGGNLGFGAPTARGIGRVGAKAALSLALSSVLGPLGPVVANALINQVMPSAPEAPTIGLTDIDPGPPGTPEQVAGFEAPPDYQNAPITTEPVADLDVAPMPNAPVTSEPLGDDDFEDAGPTGNSFGSQDAGATGGTGDAFSDQAGGLDDDPTGGFDGASVDGAATDGAATDGAATDGATDGAATDGAGMDGAGTDGAGMDGGMDGAGMDGGMDGAGADGGTDGATDGGDDGATDGSTDGAADDGGTDGADDGTDDGADDGTDDGATDGATDDGATDDGAADGAADDGAADDGAADDGAGDGAGDDGAGDDGADDDGGMRAGGPIGDDADAKFEPVPITAHEGEFVLRPEAVSLVGEDILNQINNAASMSPQQVQGLMLQAMGRIMAGGTGQDGGDFEAAGSPPAPPGPAPSPAEEFATPEGAPPMPPMAAAPPAMDEAEPMEGEEEMPEEPPYRRGGKVKGKSRLSKVRV